MPIFCHCRQAEGFQFRRFNSFDRGCHYVTTNPMIGECRHETLRRIIFRHGKRKQNRRVHGSVALISEIIPLIKLGCNAPTLQQALKTSFGQSCRHETRRKAASPPESSRIGVHSEDETVGEVNMNESFRLISGITSIPSSATSILSLPIFVIHNSHLTNTSGACVLRLSSHASASDAFEIDRQDDSKEA